MKALVNFVFVVASAFFTFAFLVILFKPRGGQISSPEVIQVIKNALSVLTWSSPVITVITLARWVYKWPAPISWFHLGFGMVAVLGWLYTVLASMQETGGGSILMTRILIPAAFPILGALIAFAAIKWYKNRALQRPN